MSETFAISLPGRGLLRISGGDAFQFLQNLITNDMRLLETQPSIYACLLNVQGKFLFDFFIRRGGSDYLLECEGGARLQDLVKRLSIYKLRSDVSFDVNEAQSVYAVLGSDQYGVSDPRHADLGYRTFDKPDLPEGPFDVWDEQRIKLAVPDGSRDIIPEESRLLDHNIEQVNGVSWEKGCYVGQEPTAKIHFRGTLKRVLAPVAFSKSVPAFGTDIRDESGALLGDMRSSCGQIGLALLRKDAVQKALDAGEALPFKQLSRG